MIPERFKWLTEGEVRRLGGLFADAGFELHLVGGSVRDALLGREGRQDMDFATSARPPAVKFLLRGWADNLYAVGERFGTIAAHKDGFLYEITTFRSEAYEPDSRRPQVKYGDSIEKDLSRRDFTVNAMALSLTEDPLQLCDPYGGMTDVDRGVLRTPLGPQVSFSDDPLRMLRLFRFAAQLGFRPGPEELAAVGEMADRLRIVSPERIRDELSKLLVAPGARSGMEGLASSGLAEEFIPEIPALAMETDPDHRHKDVLAHSLAVMEKTEPDLVLRLAALFHDVGKPATRRFAGPRVTFHSHEVVGARMTRQRLRELRYPKEVISQVTELVFLHMRAHTFKMGWTDSAVRRYVRDAGPLLDKLNQLVRCDVTTANERKERAIARQMDELEERIAHLRAREELDALRPPVDGNQVMKYLGIPPGRQVGEILKMLLEKRIEDGPYQPQEAYALVREWAVRQGLDDPGPPPPDPPAAPEPVSGG